MCESGVGWLFFFFQTRDGIRGAPGSRGLGGVYKGQEKGGGWDGVRDYQASNNMKAMKIGDWGFFYHSVLSLIHI